MGQNIFEELDELLGEALKEAAAVKQVRDAQARLKCGGQSSREREEDAERIRVWELENIWTPKATVACYERYSCTFCGHHQTIFRQLMVRYEAKNSPTTKRWVATEAIDPELPHEVAIRKFHSGMCVRCGPGEGFPLVNVKYEEW